MTPRNLAVLILKKAVAGGADEGANIGPRYCADFLNIPGDFTTIQAGLHYAAEQDWVEQHHSDFGLTAAGVAVGRSHAD